MTDDDLRKRIDVLTTLGRKRRKLAAELADLSRVMPPLVVAAARRGVRPARLRDLSGYSDEQVRRILREAGIGPGGEPLVCPECAKHDHNCIDWPNCPARLAR